jgi:hypothetical protein
MNCLKLNAVDPQGLHQGIEGGVAGVKRVPQRL